MDQPGRHRFTGAEVERMVELGILGEHERFELLLGDLVLAPPQGPIHAGLIERIHGVLNLVYPEHRIRAGLPIVASQHSEPEPDLAVAKGPQERHPLCSEAVLVIEVAFTSLKIDRDKAHIYCAGGVPEYWIVNVQGRQLEQYTEPVLKNGCYLTRRVLDETESITLPQQQQEWLWSVASLLP